MNRGPNDRGAEVLELNNNFENPAFHRDPIYETIPEAAAAGPIIRLGANNGVHELGFPDDRNAIHIDQSGNRFDPKNDNFLSDRRTEAEQSVLRAMYNPRNRPYASLQRATRGYANLHRPVLQGQGMRESQNEKDGSVRDGQNCARPANSHCDLPRDKSRTATWRSDNMKPADGHYKIPRHGRKMLPVIAQFLRKNHKFDSEIP